MDLRILKPNILVIDNTFRYRSNPLPSDVESAVSSDVARTIPHGVPDEFLEDSDTEADLENVQVTEKAGKDGSIRMEMRLSLPSSAFGFVIGKKGETKRRIESEIGCEIWVPPMGDSSSSVVVTARDKRCLVSAKTRLELIVENARSKLPFTHFLSVPVGNQTVQERYLLFRDQILDVCGGDRGIEPRLFCSPARLHATLGILVLLSPVEIQEAQKLLRSFADEHLSRVREPLHVRLQGLDVMNDDHTQVRVLYAVVYCPVLQELADKIEQHFYKAGLLRRTHQRQNVKLHVTLMNSVFLADLDPLVQPDSDSGTFDASHLMSKFEDFDFGETVVKDVHISCRFGASDDEYYKKLTSVLFQTDSLAVFRLPTTRLSHLMVVNDNMQCV